MPSKNQPTQKTVTIIYGKNDVKKQRVIERICNGKSPHQFKQEDLNKDGNLIISNASTNIFYTNCTDIEPFEKLISENTQEERYSKSHFYNQDRAGNLKEITDPQLIIENASLTSADMDYFSTMEHVLLIS